MQRFAAGRLTAADRGRAFPQVTTSTHKYMLQVQLFAPKLKVESSLLLPQPHAQYLLHEQLLAQAEDPVFGGVSSGEGDTLQPPLPRWGGNCAAHARWSSPVLTGGPEGPLGPSFPVSPGGPLAPGGPGGPGGPVAPSRPWSPWKNVTQTQ